MNNHDQRSARVLIMSFCCFCYSDPEKVLGKSHQLLNTRPDVKESLLKNIARRLTPQAIKIRADLELSCFTYEGIDAIRTALKAGENCGTPEMPVKVRKPQGQ